MASLGAPTSYSALLSLPTELRCHIYDYLLADRHAITITAAPITVFGCNIQDRARKTEIPGLPLHLAPLVRSHYDPALLSATNPPTVALEDGWEGDCDGGRIPDPAPLALLQTCQQIYDELSDFMEGKRRKTAKHSLQCDLDDADSIQTQEKKIVDSEDEGLSLHVSFPYGVLVLKTLYPGLLKLARRVYISGHFTSPASVEPGSPLSDSSASDASEGESLTPTGSFASTSGAVTTNSSMVQRSAPYNLRSRLAARAAHSNSISRPNSGRPRLRLDPPRVHTQQAPPEITLAFPPVCLDTSTLASSALSHLMRTLMPPEPTQITKVVARLVYPGITSYQTVWSDENSPVTHILRSTCGGNIDMRVQRGNIGTGLIVEVTPNPRQRKVSSAWTVWNAASRVRTPGTRALRTSQTPSLQQLDEFLTGDKQK